jgi:hypothetical protein
VPASISTSQTLVSVDPLVGVARDVKRAPPRSWVNVAGAGSTGISVSFVN